MSACTLQEFKIQNMVGSCDVKFPIRLEGLASTHAMFCSVSGRRLPARPCNGAAALHPAAGSNGICSGVSPCL